METRRDSVKERESEQLERDVQDFLRHGGSVEKLKIGQVSKPLKHADPNHVSARVATSQRGRRSD